MFSHRLKHGVAMSMREIIFGLEDSLVSTLGALTGIAAGAQSTYIVILSGLVLVVVEATSMAAGSYLSSKSATEAEELVELEDGRVTPTNKSFPLRGGIVMGVCYFFGGFVPLFPYFFLPVDLAFGPSIIATAIVLFLVGVGSASFAKRPLVRGGLEMVSVSLGAAVVGFVIGRAVSATFHVPIAP